MKNKQDLKLRIAELELAKNLASLSGNFPLFSALCQDLRVLQREIKDKEVRNDKI